MGADENGAEPIEVALEHVAEELRLNRETIAEVFPSRPKAIQIRRVAYLGSASAVLSLLAVAAILAVSLAITVPTLDILKRATGPSAVKQSTSATTQAENRIIVCTENHDDRRLASLDGLLIPHLLKGCPTDSVSAP